jgi:hypothetical protein
MIWFPAEIEVISCSRRYHIQNNSEEARNNLWEWVSFGEWISMQESPRLIKKVWEYKGKIIERSVNSKF